MAEPHPSLLRFVREGSFPSDLRVTMPIANSAVEHGLAPLLDDAARRAHLRGDREAFVKLAMHSLDSAAAERAASAVLMQAVDVANSLGIEIALFKGFAIGSRWYARRALRPSVDVDIFVNPSQSDHIGELVTALAPDMSHTAIDTMVAEGRVFEYALNVDDVTIDVHADPMNLVVPSLQRQLIWQRTQPLALQSGRTVRGLDLETSIIQALLHLLRDDFADLLHIYDIARMIDADPDWSFIDTFAAAEGWQDLVRFSLSTVCNTLERPSPLPTTIAPVNRVMTHVIWPERIRLRGADRLFQGAQRQSTASLLISGRRLEVAAALSRRVFPPRSVIDDRHGPSEASYPVALMRWRRTQRAEIRRQRSTTRSTTHHATR